MHVIIRTDSSDGPEAIGPYDTDKEAFDNLFAWWIEAGIAEDNEDAQRIYDSTPATWVVSVSDPYTLQNSASRWR